MYFYEIIFWNILIKYQENNFTEINAFCLTVITSAKLLLRQIQNEHTLLLLLLTAEVIQQVTTVSGPELIISSTSALSVLSDSSFTERLRIFNDHSKIVLVDSIWHSQTAPIWTAPAGLLWHTFKSNLHHFLVGSSLFYPAVSPLILTAIYFGTYKICVIVQPEWMDCSFLAMNLLAAKRKEWASKELLTFMYTAWLEKQWKGTSQKLKCWSSFFDYQYSEHTHTNSSVHLSCSSAIIFW